MAVFATLVSDETDLCSVKLMLNSKRSFAGGFSSLPALVYTLVEVGDTFSEFPEVGVVGIHHRASHAKCLFSAKALA